MGLILQFLDVVFGGGRNAVAETVGAFRENAEAGAERAAEMQKQALAQLGDEFSAPRRTLFDAIMDGINRLPRPAMALATLGLFAAAMLDPIWFAARMQGIALVPEPLWWLLGVIVSFYFGARHQVKAQAFQRDMAVTMARVPQVVENINALREIRSDRGEEAVPTSGPEENPALEAWRALRAGR